MLGNWGDTNGEELVVCRRNAERIEVHCHGGIAAIRAIAATLVAVGCREIGWREWLQHSNEDPIRAAAHIALAEANTARTAAILLDQFNGALTTSTREVLATIEREDWDVAATQIAKVLEWRELGLHLTTPWRVVIAGPPNVGKSSLINALAGFERAIVSPIPGTTRDVVTLHTAFDGWPVQLADTAGLRETTDELESAGIHLAQSVLATADLVVMVQDATQPGLIIDPNPRKHPIHQRVIRVRNKIDLCPTEAASPDHKSQSADETVIDTSAATGQGIPNLAATIAKSLVHALPAPGVAVPFTAPQIEIFIVARNAIERRRKDSAVDALKSLLVARQV
jgi:tRNA modification GTPase